MGLPNQADVDQCMHIVDKKYSQAEFKKFTPAKKQRLWQLQNKIKGTGRNGGAYHASSVSEAGTKCKSPPPYPDKNYDAPSNDYNHTGDYEDQKWNQTSSNLRKSPPLGCQVYYKEEK